MFDKTIIMNPGTDNQLAVSIYIHDDKEAADLFIGNRLYVLRPEWLDTESDLRQLLRGERVDTYFAVINMLKELAQ